MPQINETASTPTRQDTQVSYDGQAQARASLAFTDPGRPAIDTIDLQETREIIIGKERPESEEEAQVQELKKLLSPQGTLGLFISEIPARYPARTDP